MSPEEELAELNGKFEDLKREGKIPEESRLAAAKILEKKFSVIEALLESSDARSNAETSSRYRSEAIKTLEIIRDTYDKLSESETDFLKKGIYSLQALEFLKEISIFEANNTAQENISRKKGKSPSSIQKDPKKISSEPILTGTTDEWIKEELIQSTEKGATSNIEKVNARAGVLMSVGNFEELRVFVSKVYPMLRHAEKDSFLSGMEELKKHYDDKDIDEAVVHGLYGNKELKEILREVPKVAWFKTGTEDKCSHPTQEHNFVCRYINSLIAASKTTQEDVAKFLRDINREDLSKLVVPAQEERKFQKLYSSAMEHSENNDKDRVTHPDIFKVLDAASVGDYELFRQEMKKIDFSDLSNVFLRGEIKYVNNNQEVFTVNPLLELAKADSTMLQELLDYYSVKKGEINAFKKMSKAAAAIIEQKEGENLPEKSKQILEQFAAVSNSAKLKAGAKDMKRKMETASPVVEQRNNTADFNSSQDIKAAEVSKNIDEKLAKLQDVVKKNLPIQGQVDLLKEYQNLPPKEKQKFASTKIQYVITNLLTELRKSDDFLGQFTNFVKRVKEASPKKVIDDIIDVTYTRIKNDNQINHKSDIYTSLASALYFVPSLENIKNVAGDDTEFIKAILSNVPKVACLNSGIHEKEMLYPEKEHEFVCEYINSLIAENKISQDNMQKLLRDINREDLSKLVLVNQVVRGVSREDLSKWILATQEKRKFQNLHRVVAEHPENKPPLLLHSDIFKVLDAASVGDYEVFVKEMKKIDFSDLSHVFSRGEIKYQYSDPNSPGEFTVNPLLELAKADSVMLQKLLDYSVKKGGIEAFNKMSKAAAAIIEQSKGEILPDKSKQILEQFAAGSNLAKLKAGAKYMKGQVKTAAKAVKGGGKEYYYVTKGDDDGHFIISKGTETNVFGLEDKRGVKYSLDLDGKAHILGKTGWIEIDDAKKPVFLSKIYSAILNKELTPENIGDRALHFSLEGRVLSEGKILERLPRELNMRAPLLKELEKELTPENIRARALYSSSENGALLEGEILEKLPSMLKTKALMLKLRNAASAKKDKLSEEVNDHVRILINQKDFEGLKSFISTVYPMLTGKQKFYLLDEIKQLKYSGNARDINKAVQKGLYGDSEVEDILRNLPKVLKNDSNNESYEPHDLSIEPEHIVVKDFMGVSGARHLIEICSKMNREDLNNYLFNQYDNKFDKLAKEQRKGLTGNIPAEIDDKCKTLKLLGFISTGDRKAFSFGGKDKLMNSEKLIEIFSKTERMTLIGSEGERFTINPLLELAKADSEMLEKLLDYSVKKGGIEAFKKMSKAAGDVIKQSAEKGEILPEKSKQILEQFAAGSNLGKLKAGAKYMQGQIETAAKAVKRGAKEGLGR